MFCVDITLIATHFNHAPEATTLFSFLQEVIFVLDFRDKDLYIVCDCVKISHIQRHALKIYILRDL
jgi:hypothetical protein